MRSLIRSDFRLARFRAFASLFGALSAFAFCVAVGATGGCALSVPLSPLSADMSDDITGSIPKPAAASKNEGFSPSLNAEDWRRAQAALGTALDPQGNGAEVTWGNPESGMKGSVTSASLPYPKDGKVCRAFSAKIEGGKTPEELQGVACRLSLIDWRVESVTQKNRAKA